MGIDPPDNSGNGDNEFGGLRPRPLEMERSTARRKIQTMCRAIPCIPLNSRRLTWVPEAHGEGPRPESRSPLPPALCTRSQRCRLLINQRTEKFREAFLLPSSSQQAASIRGKPLADSLPFPQSRLVAARQAPAEWRSSSRPAHLRRYAQPRLTRSVAAPPTRRRAHRSDWHCA